MPFDQVKPDRTLSEIAYLAGFYDQSYFNRIFKALTGQNPSDNMKKFAQKVIPVQIVIFILLFGCGFG